jgi:signal peptidase I
MLRNQHAQDLGNPRMKCATAHLEHRALGGYVAAMQNGPGEAKLTWRSRQMRPRVFAISLTLAIACYGFFTWVLWPVKISGESMLPNYHNGSRHFVNKTAYWTARPQRGDVVGLRAPDGDILIKRIVGLPGEEVKVIEGRISINGVVLKEPYSRSRIPLTNATPTALGPHDYFVAGDNRGISVFGRVSEKHILGKIVF